MTTKNASTDTVEVGLLQDRIGRNVYEVACQRCGGEAHRVRCTEDENEEFGCGRPYECCSRAFVCKTCKARWRGKAEAPEME